MKQIQRAVSRILKIAGQEDREVETKVNCRVAEDMQDMLDLVGGNKQLALAYFNDGRWAELRTKVSNALSGKSPEQKSVDRMIESMKILNPALTDEQVRTLILSMPGLEAATKVNTEPLPKEINEDYFDLKKAAKEEKKSAAGPKIGK